MASSNVIQIAPIPAEIRDRIVEVANALFEQAGHATFPTVDQVRRSARADMNAVSTVMREWRREQSARAAPLPIQIPEPITAAGNAAMAALWLQAQSIANESLQAAQGAWEAERAQEVTLREEMASAYDALAAELEALRADTAAATRARDQVEAALRAELTNAQAAAAEALGRADRATTQSLDLQAAADRLTADVDQLRKALDQAHSDLARTQTQLEADTDRHKEHRQHAAQEAQRLAERMTTATGERDQARREASTAEKERATAREAEARLQGQVDAMREQLATLTRAIGGAAPGAGGR